MPRQLPHRRARRATRTWPGSDPLAPIRPEAIAAGFHSVHALPMRLRGTSLGVLNLFHGKARRTVDRRLAVAQALADVATIAILQHRAAQEAQS